MKVGQETISASSILQTSVSMTSFSESMPRVKSPKSKQTGNTSLTGSFQFESILASDAQTKPDRKVGAPKSVTATADYLASAYKLIDLGTAVAVHEVEEYERAETLKTVTEMAFAG
jgi:hypothetical protein